jgi:hypothetical protein
MRLLTSISFAFFILTGAIANAETSVTLNKTDFILNGDIIPSGCIAQLMTQLNGDNIVSSLFLTSASLRGCINANNTYPSGDQDQVEVVKAQKLNDNSFAVKVCESVNGSMRAHCDSFLIQFGTKEYRVNGTVKTVVTMQKIGDWD